MSSKAVKSTSSVELEAAIAKAAEEVFGPRPVQAETPNAQSSNDVTVAILREAIEWNQTSAEHARWAVHKAEEAVREASQLAVRLKHREEKLATKLYLHCKAIGMPQAEIRALMHELDQDCEEDGCKSCHDQFREGK